MTETTPPRRSSRLANQPAPVPLSPNAVPPREPRPSYAELRAGEAGSDYSALGPHIADPVRSALSLPLAPATLVIDGPLRRTIREFFLAHPEQTASLPNTARLLLAL